MRSLGPHKKSVSSELHDGTITALSAKGGRGERVAVYLDGHKAFDVSALVADGAGLHKDQVLTAEQQAVLLRQDEPYRAREISLRMLARRDLASSEVVEKLRNAGISSESASATVQWLQELRYVDDAQYAAAYMTAKDGAGWGRHRIVSELCRKGLDRSVVEEAWEAWSEDREPADVVKRSAEMVVKRFGGQLASDPQGAKRRISAFLARRGHDWETIAAVLDAVEQDDPRPLQGG